MGCVSSSLLNQDEGSTALGHHIVSLTSTTYGLLNLDSPQSQSSAAAATTCPLATPLSESRAIRSELEVINSWELMAGLDSNDSFRFSPLPLSNSSNSKPGTPKFFSLPKSNFQSQTQDRENRDPNIINICRPFPRIVPNNGILSLKPSDSGEEEVRTSSEVQAKLKYSLDGFDKVCPPVPNGDNKVVLYTTTLRGVRSTFEACNAVRSALQSLGFSFCERDISMDRGFRDEFRRQRSTSSLDWVPPRLFIKGRYVGGADEVLNIHDQGGLSDLLQGLPKLKPGVLCDGCGGFSFLPCFRCHGSCKLVMLVNPHDFSTNININKLTTDTVVMTCPDCNENGLVLCPICS